MSGPYASVSFAPHAAKTFGDLAAIQRHNNREEPLAHVVEGAPPPRHLIGSGDLRADVRRLVTEAGIDPDQRRSNGVLAWEVVFSADHEWFGEGTPSEQRDRLNLWVDAVPSFVIAHWGAHRVASLVLHRDEFTPHFHSVVVPLHAEDTTVANPDWRLVGRVLTGPGRWAQLHTDYAAAVASLGLHRGKVGSERKRKPYGELLEELKAREARAASDQRKAEDTWVAAARSQLANLNEETRLRAWALTLQKEADEIAAGRKKQRIAEQAAAAAEAAASAALQMAERDRAAAAHDRREAARLRQIIFNAQAAARRVVAAIAEHKRETPATAEVIRAGDKLREQVAHIAEAIHGDSALQRQRDRAW